MLEHHIKNCVFDLECKKSWQSMPVVESKNKKWWRFSTKGEVRFCSDCEKKVYQCSSNDELTKNINLNSDIYSFAIYLLYEWRANDSSNS